MLKKYGFNLGSYLNKIVINYFRRVVKNEFKKYSRTTPQIYKEIKPYFFNHVYDRTSLNHCLTRLCIVGLLDREWNSKGFYEWVVSKIIWDEGIDWLILGNLCFVKLPPGGTYTLNLE